MHTYPHRSADGAGVPALERRLFLGSVTVGLLHPVDDAVVNRQPGVPVGQHLTGLAAVTAACLAAWLAFPRLRPGLRAGLALVMGAVTVTNGALHAAHVVTAGPAASDLTGILATTSGLVLVALGISIPWAHRRERRSTPRRRWVNRAAAVAIGAAVVPFVILPISVGLVQTHQYRRHVGAPPTGAFRTVSFDTTDGLTLAGWYLPSQNRAAVVVVNSARGDRSGSVRHAKLLASHGYGVLLYDARGTGESDGSPNGWGWSWKHDVDAALTFLQRQPDVDPDRLGGLGLSTGADVLIEVAATNRTLHAVVADGATARSFAERLPGPLNAAAAWPMFAAAEVLGGSTAGEPLRDLVAGPGADPPAVDRGGLDSGGDPAQPRLRQRGWPSDTAVAPRGRQPYQRDHPGQEGV
jgi:hypothetical protein